MVFYDLSFRDPIGRTLVMSDFKGKVVLVVGT